MKRSLLSARRRAREASPLDWVEDLPGQAAFLAATTRRVVWFGANGTGKTNALARRLVRVFTGQDPICRGVTRPLSILVIVTGYDVVSSRDLAEQIHRYAPAGLLGQVPLDDHGRPVSRSLPWYAPGKGFRGRPPRIVVQRGLMRGSVLNVSTLGSGSGASAGGTIDLIVVNEPITRALMDELTTRDRAEALGYLWYPFTPTLDAPDQTWIPQWVEDQSGQAVYLTSPLTRANLTFPSGRTLEDWDAKTAPRIASWSAVERPMRMGRSLEPLIEGAIFADIWHDGLVADDLPDGPTWWLVHSVDHGLKPGRMRAGLTAYHVTGRGSSRRLVGYDVIDVAGGSNYDATAEAFLAELERMFPRAEDGQHQIGRIDSAVGDRSIQADYGLVRRDNWAWRRALLQALRRRERNPSLYLPRPVWEIVTPYKPPGSVHYRIYQLHQAMAEDPPRFRILRHLHQGIQDVQRFDGQKASPHKDYLDRVGYGWELAHRHYGLWQDGPG